MLDRCAQALADHSVRRAPACLTPPNHIRPPGFRLQKEPVARFAWNQAGLSDCISELVGVRPKAAVSARPAVRYLDVPPKNERIGFRVVDLELYRLEIA